MLVAHSTTPRLELSPPGTAALLQAVIDPIVVIGVLLACVLAFEGRFDAPYLILSLIVFPMTFPGGFARGAVNGALARTIVTGWLAVAVLLLMLGWATQTLEAFDQRAILAWLLATPVAYSLLDDAAAWAKARLARGRGREDRGEDEIDRPSVVSIAA